MAEWEVSICGACSYCVNSSSLFPPLRGTQLGRVSTLGRTCSNQELSFLPWVGVSSGRGWGCGGGGCRRLLRAAEICSPANTAELLEVNGSDQPVSSRMVPPGPTFLLLNRTFSSSAHLGVPALDFCL